jgi:hypothetical protein
MSIRSVGSQNGNETHVFPNKNLGISAMTTYTVNVLYGKLFVNILSMKLCGGFRP